LGFKLGQLPVDDRKNKFSFELFKVRIKEIVAKLRFCRFSGSFEPIFGFFRRGNIIFTDMTPAKKIKKRPK
jgi:hypothetical protein